MMHTLITEITLCIASRACASCGSRPDSPRCFEHREGCYTLYRKEAQGIYEQFIQPIQNAILGEQNDNKNKPYNAGYALLNQVEKLVKENELSRKLIYAMEAFDAVVGNPECWPDQAQRKRDTETAAHNVIQARAEWNQHVVNEGTHGNNL